MTHEQVMERLTKIFQELFDDESIVLTDETTAADIEDWDSLAHMELISETEAVFEIHFTLGEITNFANVGEMCNCIMKHLGT